MSASRSDVISLAEPEMGDVVGGEAPKRVDDRVVLSPPLPVASSRLSLDSKSATRVARPAFCCCKSILEDCVLSSS